MRKPTDKLKAEAEAANRRIYERLKVIHSLFEPYTRLSEQRQALAWIDDALDWVEGK